ncbi:MAG: hypothetical protein HY287_01475 [Planctomycetes bacterium]|nr:hypothetical protein [Planctomycetota bacterium]MBI3832978.1 hypothetical protein [Planctomycetota bacterium]
MAISWKNSMAVVATVTLVAWMAGCNGFGLPGGGLQGPKGDPGPQGPTGSPGLDAGSDLPGTAINIKNVNQGNPVQTGQPFSVTFSLETLAGKVIPVNDLARFSIYVSGSTTNYQTVIPPEGDLTKVTSNADGTYTYTFANAYPATFSAPLNDSTAFGPVDGELTGQAIAAGTHTVGIEARRDFTIEGTTYRDAGDAAFDFGVNGAPIVSRQVVMQDNCNKCHTQLTVHGSNRFSVTNCVLCHTRGAEDKISSDPSKATPGVTIQFANLIHSIHRGAELPNVTATKNSSDPFLYEIIGFGESVNDFSDIEFPVMPGGNGFNEQTRNCGACHVGAAQGDNAYNNPSRVACGACHDDIDWTAGTILDQTKPEVSGGLLTKSQLSDPAFRTLFLGALQHTFADGSCTQCHNSTNPALDPAQVHKPPLSRDDLTTGLSVEIQSVTGGTGAGFFQAGDVPQVTFQLKDRNGNAVDIGDVASVNLVLSGPVDNYQHILPAAGSTASLKGAGGVPDTGTGPFTYTSVEPLPTAFPPPLNDSTAFDFNGGWGELSGQPLSSGSYTVMVYAYRQFDFDGVTYRETSSPALAQIRVGSSGTADAHVPVVTDTTCNACHGDLRFHGNTRKGVEGCVLCHSSAAEDRPNVLAGQSQDPTPDTIDFRVLIHKIHYAENLDLVTNGGKYDIVGFAPGQPSDTGNVNDFSGGTLPTMPAGAEQCITCHVSDAWKVPVERSDINIWKVACTSCHDSSATAAHVQLNTLGIGQEACSVCHGADAAFSVENVHKVRITGLK